MSIFLGQPHNRRYCKLDILKVLLEEDILGLFKHISNQTASLSGGKMILNIDISLCELTLVIT